MSKPEVITIRNTSGGASQGAAEEVVRYSDTFRKTTGVLYIVGGMLGAGVCLIAIGPHIFITTWLLPLLGIYLGLRTFKRRTMIYDIVGTCPTCEKPIELHGGSIDDDRWQKCPECAAPLAIEAAESPVAAGS